MQRKTSGAPARTAAAAPARASAPALAATLAALLTTAVATQPAAAQTAAATDSTQATSTSWRTFMDDADAALSFRYRFEHVDDDDFDERAKASTLRTRLSLKSGEAHGLSMLLEFEDVREVGADDFNAGGGNTPSRSDYPVVADVEGTEVNQAYADYRHGGFRARVGRQRINLDNQRFVGGVGWRQNEQTFDAVKLDYGSEQHRNIKAQYVYVSRVRRIFGDDVPAGRHDQDGTHLLNVSLDAGAAGRLVGYHYRIDNEDALAFSTSTTGLRLTGSALLNDTGTAGDDLELKYTAEFATQTDTADNPNDYRASYWNLDAAIAFGQYDVGLGWEVLDGDDGRSGEAFVTPLATLHAFNGWADRFLSTPPAGLDDRYLKVGVNAGRALARLRYHRFEAADGGGDLGQEVDVQLGYKVNDWLRADLFAAYFDGDGTTRDTEKLWFMLTASL